MMDSRCLLGRLHTRCKTGLILDPEVMYVLAHRLQDRRPWLRVVVSVDRMKFIYTPHDQKPQQSSATSIQPDPDLLSVEHSVTLLFSATGCTDVRSSAWQLYQFRGQHGHPVLGDDEIISQKVGNGSSDSGTSKGNSNTAVLSEASPVMRSMLRTCPG